MIKSTSFISYVFISYESRREAIQEEKGEQETLMEVEGNKSSRGKQFAVNMSKVQ